MEQRQKSLSDQFAASQPQRPSFEALVVLRQEPDGSGLGFIRVPIWDKLERYLVARFERVEAAAL